MSKFQHLVVDTSAFIKNVQLQSIAEHCYTVPGVVKEIRSKRQLKALRVLLYDLEVIKPDPDAVAKVVAFSKKTGDFASLSLVDTEVIALTYQLNAIHVGVEHLREEPKSAITVSAPKKPLVLQDTDLTKGFYEPKTDDQTGDGCNQQVVSSDLVDQKNTTVLNDVGTDEEHSHEDDDAETNDECSQEIESSDLVDQQNAVVLKDVRTDEEHSREDDDAETASDSGEDNVSGDDEEDDDDEGWITPGNIVQVKRDYGTDCLEESPSSVACITTDFAMQNVLKQMGMEIAALDGRIIRQTRTFILRCYACFKTTPDASKVFCPRCGNSTLKKVSVSLDEHGQQIIHINSRHPLTAKYKNRPVGKFTGGKHAANPILYEDQPLPQQRVSAKARSRTNALAEDYTAGYSAFVMRDVDSRSAVLRGSSNLKQRMKNCEYDNARRGYTVR